MTVGTRVTQKKVEKLQQTNYISLEASISTDEELFSELISTVLENVRNMPVELQELQTVLISTQNTINNQLNHLMTRVLQKAKI
jgi:1,6-anhydro-N-acetylmuramate kinase